MTRSVPVGEVRPFGDRALLIGVADARAGGTLATALEDVWRGTDAEVVGGMATVGVMARDPDADLGALRAIVDDVLRAAPAPASTAADAVGPGRRLVIIPSAFDGPDLAEVGTLVGRSSDDVVALLTSAPLTVGAVGFSPGFAYLDGLPAPLRAVPRRDRPRPLVPAGSVALANGHAAVYPTASPGGWQLVGRTGFPLFSTDGPPYAALSPGDRVQFAARRRGGSPRADPRRSGGLDTAARGARPSSGYWRPDCAPSCRTPVVATSRRRVSRGPGRLTRCRAAWPTVWLGTRRGPRRWRSRAAGPGCAASGRATSPSSARRPPCASTARRSRRDNWCRWRRDRCSRSARCGAAAAPMSRSPAACSGPPCSGASAATSSAGWAGGPSGRAIACVRGRGPRRSATTWRPVPRRSCPRRGRSSCACWRAPTSSASAPGCWNGWPRCRFASGPPATGSVCACSPMGSSTSAPSPVSSIPSRW